MGRNCGHAHCPFCGKCFTCQPHPAHTDKYGNPK